MVECLPFSGLKCGPASISRLKCAGHRFSRLTWNWLIFESAPLPTSLPASAFRNAPTNFYLSAKCIPLTLVEIRWHCDSGRREREREARWRRTAHWWNWLFMLLPLTSCRSAASAAVGVDVSVNGNGWNWIWIFGIKFLFTSGRFLVCLFASRKSDRCAPALQNIIKQETTKIKKTETKAPESVKCS